MDVVRDQPTGESHMKTRNKRIAGIAAVGLLVGGGIGGAFAATSGQGDPAGDLASALSERTGEQVSAADVKGAFTDVLKERLQQDVASGRITQTQADEMLTRAQNAPLPGMGGPGGHRGDHHGGHHGGPGGGAVEDAMVKALGITEDAWHTAREAGKTPAQVAKEKGIAVATVVDAVTAALDKQGPPPGVPAVDDAQLKQMATDIVNGTGRGGHHRP